MENQAIIEDITIAEHDDTNEEQSKKCKKKSCCLKSSMPKVNKKKQKKIAKIGLVSILALTTVSGFMHSGTAKKVHIASGIALVGLSAWHVSLYKCKKSKKCSTKENNNSLEN